MIRRIWVYGNDGEKGRSISAVPPAELDLGGAYLPLLWLPRTPPASTANIRQGKAPEEPPLCFSGKLNCQQSVIVTAKLTTQITLLAEAVFLWGNRPLSTDSYTETYWDLSSFKACCVFTGRGLHCLWIQGLSCLCALLMFYGNSILCFPPLVCWSDADVPCMRVSEIVRSRATQMASLLLSQVPFNQPDHSLQILLSLQQDSALLETLPLHINQLWPRTQTHSHTHTVSVFNFLSLGFLHNWAWQRKSP